MDYAPDLPIRTPGLLYDVNMVPDVSGNYVTPPVPIPLDNLTAYSNTVIAAYTFRDAQDQTNTEYHCTRNKIWLSGGLFTGSSVSATSYSVGTDGGWCMAVFGNSALAANGVSVLQYATTYGSGFTDLAGAPSPRIILNHENSLLALNLTTNAQGWACSDTGDPTQWSASPANNADAGVLYGGIGGPITAGATWQKFALAFKAGATYIGTRVEEIDQAIHWETLSNQVGCVGPNAWIETELGLIFVGQRDVYLFDGSRPRSIADAKIRRKFFQRAPSTTERVFISHDDLEKNLYFWHNSQPQGGGWANSAFVFNYKSFKWGKVDSIQTNGTSYVQARCSLVNAKGKNYYAVLSGLNSVSLANNEASNLIFLDQSGGYSTSAAVTYVAANSSGTMTRASAGKPLMTTGYMGTPGEDKTISRVLFVPETAGTNPESGSVVAVDEAANTKTAASGVNDKGMIDSVSIGRFFQATATWPTSVNKQTITDVIPEFKEQTYKIPAKGR